MVGPSPRMTDDHRRPALAKGKYVVSQALCPVSDRSGSRSLAAGGGTLGLQPLQPISTIIAPLTTANAVPHSDGTICFQLPYGEWARFDFHQ